MGFAMFWWVYVGEAWDVDECFLCLNNESIHDELMLTQFDKISQN